MNMLSPKHLLKICLPTAMVLLACVSFSLVEPASIVGQDKSREILPELFIKHRPKSKAAKGSIRRQPRVYRLTAGSSGADPKSDRLIGVTVWHLRAARRTDPGTRLLVPGSQTEYVALRTSTDTPLRPGERVRLSVESTRDGYLYVIDRELFSNNRVGPPSLIFPDTKSRSLDNKVQAGKLIELPPNNFFEAKRYSKNQIGELLNVLVTARRLDVQTDGNGVIPASDFAIWEHRWGRAVQKYELTGGMGEQLTTEERIAGTPKAERRLTQDDPLPQTLFASPEEKNDGLMISVSLRYAISQSRRRH